MRKLSIIFILLFFVTKISNAQSGIDVAFVPFFKNYFKEPMIEKLYPNQLGFKIGYFKWKSEELMRSLSFEYTSSTSNMKNDMSEYNFNSSNWDYFTRDFDYTNKAYIFTYEIYNFETEIDMKSNFYIKNIYFVGFVESSLKGSTILPITASEFDATKENGLKDYVFSDVIFGYGLGAGYQYNLNKKVGFYIDLNTNVGFYKRFENISSLVNLNLGTKYRFK